MQPDPFIKMERGHMLLDPGQRDATDDIARLNAEVWVDSPAYSDGASRIRADYRK